MRKRSLMLLAAMAVSLTMGEVASAADLARRAPPPAPALYHRRHCHIFGPDVTSAATSVGPGRIST
jgi:hypothetical protein